MKPATLYVFAGLTAAAVAGAAAAVSTQLEVTALTPGTEAAFPDLAASPNDAVKIDVQTGKSRFSMSYRDGKWRMDQKDSYPASFEKVKSAIVNVANFKLIEKKTSDPSRYARLDLDPPDEPDAKARKLALSGEDDRVLADVTVGKRNSQLFGTSGGGTYIRRGDEKETWLVRGEVEIGEEPIDWIERHIVNYGGELVRRVTVRGPENNEFTIFKEKQTDENFRLQYIPEGRRMKAEDEANPLGGVMWRMMLDDVRNAADQEWPEETWVSHYYLWEGFKVRIEVAKIGEDHWGRFVASLDEEVTDPEKREKAKETIDSINERLAGWSYMLTAGDSEKLTSKLEQYLNDPGNEQGS